MHFMQAHTQDAHILGVNYQLEDCAPPIKGARIIDFYSVGADICSKEAEPPTVHKLNLLKFHPYS